MTTETLTAAAAAATAGPAEPTAGEEHPSGALARFADRLDGWLERASDYCNPILVKETRQALKSRQFALWFLLLLAAAWIVTIGAVALIGPSIYYAASGALLYRAYFVVLAFPLTVVVPFATYRSLASEQEENTRDLLIVSALSPRQIINGKLGSALLQMLVYFSALSPCLAFTYLLRGVDLVTVLVLPVYALLVSLMLSMLGLVAASMTRKKYGQVVLSIGFIAILLSGFSWLITGAMMLIQTGYQFFRSPEFWVVNLVALNFYVTTFLLLYFGAAGLNTFTAANKSTPLRVVLFVKQACAVGWLTYGCLVSGYEVEPIAAGAIFIGIAWFTVASVMLGETPVLSNRVRRSLPTSGLVKLFGTWFNPGPGAGFMFSLANWISIAAPAVVAALVSSASQSDDIAAFLVLASAYAIIFLGFGWVTIVGLRRIAQVTMLGCFLINVLLVLGASASPLLVIAWLDTRAPSGFVNYYVFSPLVTLGSVATGSVPPEAMTWLMIGVPGVALCVLLVTLLLAGKEARLTRKPTPKRVIEDELELNPLPTPAVKNPWGDT